MRRTEALARAGTTGEASRARPRPPLASADALEACRELEESLTKTFGHEVRVRITGRRTKVEIVFDDLREAQQLAGRLAGPIAA